MARMTFQDFFRRYHRLCGASGTLQGIRHELWWTYGLMTFVVPTRLPSRLKTPAFRHFATHAEKQRVLLDVVAQLHRATGGVTDRGRVRGGRGKNASDSELLCVRARARTHTHTDTHTQTHTHTHTQPKVFLLLIPNTVVPFLVLLQVVALIATLAPMAALFQVG